MARCHGAALSAYQAAAGFCCARAAAVAGISISSTVQRRLGLIISPRRAWQPALVGRLPSPLHHYRSSWAHRASRCILWRTASRARHPHNPRRPLHIATAHYRLALASRVKNAAWATRGRWGAERAARFSRAKGLSTKRNVRRAWRASSPGRSGHRAVFARTISDGVARKGGGASNWRQKRRAWRWQTPAYDATVALYA